MNGDTMSGRMELITPEIATALLASRPSDANRTQRKMRQGRVAAYCRDRLAGRWAITHQGIAIDTNGQLIDGQHRMMMVVNTKLPTWFWVVRGVPSHPDTMHHIDDQLMRTVLDSCHIAGENVNRDDITIARSFHSYPGIETDKCTTAFNTRAEVLDTLAKWRDGISFASRLPRKCGITRAIRILVARAYYHVDIDRLGEFCAILDNGMTISANAREDAAAVSLRNYLLRTTSASGRSHEAERYRKGQSCLRSFMRREPLDKVYSCEADLYPVIMPAG